MNPPFVVSSPALSDAAGNHNGVFTQYPSLRVKTVGQAGRVLVKKCLEPVK